MPKRTDIKTILIIGSGPIVIGQGCEFDYSGTQACKALRAEGYRVVLVNSNPATIMTDPEFSDRTYIEPITPESVRKIIEKQKEIGDPIHALLPTLGGQTALNCACALFDNGTLAEFGIEMIGANRQAIHRAEDRQAFKEICERLGLKMPLSRTVTTLDEAREFLKLCGLPAIIRPAFTLGGSGGGIAYNQEEFDEIITRGLRASMIGQVLIDQSVLGWKEYELEVIRDKKDNCIVVCGIENIDPMGVHTGDSITIAPILTLTDKEYQAMRDAAFAIMRAVGVETGGSNVQFAVNPTPPMGADGEPEFQMVVVEMNPRVSRSSALASKATGFPIAKIAAKLAVGYTLDELRNDITGTTSACFEPSIDYIVTKMPRWTFEKFPEADETLTTQMKSVGEAMAIGRTFLESLQKAIRSMEVKRFGLGLDRNDKWLAARVARRSAAGLDLDPAPASTPRPNLDKVLHLIEAGSLRPVGYAARDPYPAGIYGAAPELIATRRNLPHYNLPGATYFVTWRLADGRLTPAERDTVLRSLLHFDGDRCRVYAATVMPDHIHWIVRPYDGHTLDELIKSVKHYSAVEINRARGASGHLWQDERWDHIIRNLGYFHEFVDYVIRNAVKAGLAASAEEYGWTFVHHDTVGGDPAGSEAAEPTKPAAERRATQPPLLADGQELEWPIAEDKLTRKLAVPSQGRLYYVRYAMKMGWTDERIFELCKIDRFFLDQIRRLVEFEDILCRYKRLGDVPREVLFEAKRMGYSDAQLANLYLGAISTENILRVREHRKGLGIEPVYKLVDTCAAEFEARTPYYYSTYETPVKVVGSGIKGSGDQGIKSDPNSIPRSHDASIPSADDEIRVTDKKKVIILGGGPNRIGQGIEFDYCCCHAAFSAKALGFESVMINSNPETVSTDYDTSDLLFFEPLTLEDVLNVVERLNGGALGGSALGGTALRAVSASPHETHDGTGTAQRAVPPNSGLVHGLIVQFGGQTPLNLAHGLRQAGAPIIGTSVASIDLAEDRKLFDALLERLGIGRPPGGTAHSVPEAVALAAKLGYPVLVRPSYVLGGRGMEVCSDEKALRHFMANAMELSGLDGAPVLIDKFLDRATEVDVDVIADFPPAQSSTPGSDSMPRSQGPAVPSPQALVCGVMEHIEEAGIHSGDSSCTIPPWSLAPELVDRIKTIARGLARELRVNGLMNVQMAVKDNNVYILEVNPRASRTVPFVAKAKHVPWPAIAAKVMMGKSLAELGAREVPDTGAFAVKESVFPFNKFPGVDIVLGPEMRSTGEVMGIDASFPVAFAKGQLSAGTLLPKEGAVFLSVRDTDQAAIVPVARHLMAMGFTVYSTAGTAAYLTGHGLQPTVLQKIASGARPNVLDLMRDGKIQLIINTPTKTGWQTDEGKIRATAVRLGIPIMTTTTAAAAAVRAIEALRAGDWGVAAMQDHKRLADLRAGAPLEPKTGRAGVAATEPAAVR